MSELSALDRLDWQDALFARRLNRLALMRLNVAPPRGPVLQVLRNHAVEGAVSILAPFLDYAGVALSVAIGDYDDSLNLPTDRPDAVLVWLDFDRYSRLADDELAGWIVERLDALRVHVGGALVVANSPDPGDRSERLNAELQAWASRTPAAAVLRIDEVARGLGDRAFDAARAALTGSRYSDALFLEAARTLVFDVLSPFYARPIKAVAVDLDNTLYQGVLGEDGPQGVLLSEGRADLQREIDRLSARGVLVSVLSRNEPADVEQLFAARGDFPLRPERVASWHVGWGEKSDGLRAAAAQFNIAPDAFLLIDDNIGELARVGSSFAGLRLLHAGGDAETTARALRRYPGFSRTGVAFVGRAADLNANAERVAIAQGAIDEAAYLRALQAELNFALDPVADRARLAELSRKTNQFNLALRRLDEVEVDRYLTAPDRCVVHVRLSDRLADSGSVAGVFARLEGNVLVVDELCISCRALGRKLEDLMVAEALRAAVKALGATSAAFGYQRGPRNQPALDWLAAFAGQAADSEEGRVVAPAEAYAGCAETPVTMRWTNG